MKVINLWTTREGKLLATLEDSFLIDELWGQLFVRGKYLLSLPSRPATPHFLRIWEIHFADDLTHKTIG